MARALTVVMSLAMLLPVSACGLGASRGTMPPGDANGEIDPSAVPDFVAYAGQADRIIGWVPKSYSASATPAAARTPATARIVAATDLAANRTSTTPSQPKRLDQV